MKTIGILGSGIVAKTLGSGLVKHGYQVKLGTRSPEKLNDWVKETGNNASTGDFNEAAAFGEIVILAVKGNVAQKALEMVEPSNLAQKTIIDTTNPIDEAAPENGVLKFFSSLDKSLMEELQESFPESNFVKAFNSVGSAFMIDPTFDSKPTMFTCGNNDDAKAEVHTILTQVGWEIEDMGAVEAARAIEPLCMLWCIPGFRENRWNHAFKLLKSQ